MKNKLFYIILTIIIVTLGALFWYNTQSKETTPEKITSQLPDMSLNKALADKNKKESTYQPYTDKNKDSVNDLSYQLLSDEYYQNQITATDLQAFIDNKGTGFVQYWSPTCTHCRIEAPILVPLAKQLKVDVKQLNVLEYPDFASNQGITSTPIIVYYQDGIIKNKMIGTHSKEEMQQFLTNPTK